MPTFSQAATAAVNEWQQALAWDDAICQWRQDHPDAAVISTEQTAWERSQGIPCILDAGRLHWQSRRTGESWQTLKLRNPTEHGRYLLQCRQCQKVAFTDHVMSGAGLCGTCRTEQLTERKAVQAQRRIERRRQRSAELANRKGKCLVCGDEMTVARITRTTCSDRCRKQWIRKGADAFPLPETADKVRIGEEELPLGEALERLQKARFDRGRLLSAETPGFSFSAFQAARDGDERYQLLVAAIAQVSRLIELQQLRESAPSIFLWELSQ